MKGPVYSECSWGRGFESQEVGVPRCQHGQTQLEKHPVFAQASYRVCVALPVERGRKEPGWLQPLGPIVPL